MPISGEEAGTQVHVLILLLVNGQTGLEWQKCFPVMSFSHFWMQIDTEAIRKHNLHEPIRPERVVHEKHIRLADVNGT